MFPADFADFRGKQNETCWSNIEKLKARNGVKTQYESKIIYLNFVISEAEIFILRSSLLKNKVIKHITHCLLMFFVQPAGFQIDLVFLLFGSTFSIVNKKI